MAAVPLYDPAGTQQTQAQRANAVSADNFGGAEARALAQVGGQLQQVGGKLIEIEEREKAKDDTTKVMDAYTQGTARMRQATYGEGGLYTRTGQNADGVSQLALDTSDKIRDDILKGLPDDATKEAFTNMWTRHTESAVNQATEYEFKQRQATRTATKTAALANLTDEVIANYNDKEMLATNMDAARAMIRSNPDGLPAELVTQMERASISTLNLAVIQRLAQDDPGRALDYYEQHKGQVAGADHATANAMISGVAKVREGTQAARDIYSSSAGDSIIRSVITGEHHGQDASDPAIRGRVSSAGAAGPTQLMPDTAREVAASLGMNEVAAMTDDELEAHWQTPAGDADNVRLGGTYLTKMLAKYEGDVEAALVAYNAGPKNANEWLDNGRDYSKLPMPGQTLPYVQRVLKAYTGKDITGDTSEAIQRSVRGGGQAAYYQKGDAKEFLKTKLQKQHGVEHVEGMTGPLADRLAAMFSDAPPSVQEGLDILSGTRTMERQQALWSAALKKYGSVEKARKWVAPPAGVAGSKGSQHNHGNAADLGWKGGKLSSAPPDVVAWVHKNAGSYGLRFPLSNEAWHIETAEARGGQAAKRDKPTKGDVGDSRVRRAFQAPDGGQYVPNDDGGAVEVDASVGGSAGDVYTNLTTPFREAPTKGDLQDWLETARERYAGNPSLLAEVERQLTDEHNARAAAATQEQLSIQTEVFRSLVAGKTVGEFDPLQLEKLGPEKVSSLLTLESKLKPGNKDDTDDATYYTLSKMTPEEFANANLLDYADKLSGSDFRALAGKQAELLRPNVSAAKRSTDATRADVLGSVENILGLDPNGTPADAKTMHAFTRKFNLSIESFIERNGGKEPTGTEMQDMADQLMVEGTIRDKYLGGLITNDRTVRVFNMTGEELDTFRSVETVDAIPEDVKPQVANTFRTIYKADPDEDGAVQMFNDLAVVQAGGAPPPPRDLQARITQGLSKTLGRMPNDDEIAAFYREWIIRAQAVK